MNRARTALMTLALASSTLAAPALADIGPPRVLPTRPYKPVVPEKLDTWFVISVAAMREGSVRIARNLCDERGFEQNLAGNGGTTLASLFAQGHRKQWHLEVDATKIERSHRDSFIATAHVVDDTDTKRLDTLHLFLIPEPDGSYRALGASEDRAEVEALASRWRKNQDLASPPTKGD